MTKLAMTFILGGFLLVFGAVGGMEDPGKADYFIEQLAVAIAGIFFAFIGTVILPQEDA